MKVLAINGSARKEGNTTALIKHVLTELEKEGIQTELIELAGKKVRGCAACYKCMENKDKKCSVATDYVNHVIERMIEADGIILGSPTYFANVSAEMKGLIDRSGMVARANDNMLRLKAGAAVVAARRAGSIHAFDTINHFFFVNEMIVPGSIHWNVAFGRNKGEVEKDEEGIAGMKNLGKNMAWLLKRIAV
ncbi:MAG: flavodoxin family protein [Deltaproteobacteria bacterium]|nr:flavodoxin family protein [Deltaproteobacteria bacterium]